jgi:hypothetical protein
LISAKLKELLPLLLIAAVVTGVWLATCLEAPDPVENILADEMGHANVILRVLAGAAPTAKIVTFSKHYPPLFYLLSFACGKILAGTSRAILALPNLLMLLGALAILRRLAADLYGPRSFSFWLVGPVVAAYLLPSTYVITTEMALVFSTLLFTYACVELQSKDRIRYFLLLTFGTALALLARTTAPVFILVPTLWLFWTRAKNKNRVRFFGMAGMSLAAGGIIAFCIYYRIWFSLGLNPVGVMLNRASYGETVWSNAVAYGSVLGTSFFPVLILLGVVALLQRFRIGAHTGWLLACALFPITVMIAIKALYTYHIAAAVPLLLLALIGPAATARKDRPALVPAAILLVALNLLLLVRPLAWDRANLIWHHERDSTAYRAALDTYFEISPDDSKVVFAGWSGRGVGANMLENYLYRGYGNTVQIEYFTGRQEADLILVLRSDGTGIDHSRCYSDREWELWNTWTPTYRTGVPTLAAVQRLIHGYEIVPSDPPVQSPKVAVCRRRSGS